MCVPLWASTCSFDLRAFSHQITIHSSNQSTNPQSHNPQITIQRGKFINAVFGFVVLLSGVKKLGVAAI